MGFSPYILLQKYIILLLGTVCRKFDPCFGKFLGTTFERMAKFFCRLVEDMDRSPIENNPRPTLRGTSTCFTGAPGGVRRCGQRTPPYPFFNATALVCSGLGGCQGYRRCRGESGNLSPRRKLQIIFTPSRFVQVRQCMSPLKGARRKQRGSGRFSARVY